MRPMVYSTRTCVYVLDGVLLVRLPMTYASASERWTIAVRTQRVVDVVFARKRSHTDLCAMTILGDTVCKYHMPCPIVARLSCANSSNENVGTSYQNIVFGKLLGKRTKKYLAFDRRYTR